VRFLSAFVLPPDGTITHTLAMAERHNRLSRLAARARRLRRHARAEAKHHLGAGSV
jgi:RecB family exonuclease